MIMRDQRQRALDADITLIDGADVRTSIKGAGIIVLLYVATLVIFLSLKDLQFWDYG